MLRQTLAIAVDNAVRYAVPGLVAVDASVEDDRLVLRVTDHGPGFAEESAGAGSHGAGMGLELARSLLDLAGGELRVERAGPDGTCVAVRLPLDNEQ